MDDDTTLTDEETAKPKPKPLKWIGSSKDDLKEFPDQVQKAMGHALHLAQINLKAPNAKPLRGLGGASVLEVVEDYDRSTYRAVYTVKFQGMVYVLHAFQKKSKKGIETPKHDIDLIKTRLKAATEHYENQKQQKDKKP
jgi:phage-related protein